MVTCIVDGLERALEIGKTSVDDGIALRAPLPRGGAELVTSGYGELTAEVLMVVPQDVDAELPRVTDTGPGGARHRGAQENERRGERQRCKGLDGHPDRSVALTAGDDHYPGTEVPQHRTVGIRIKTQRPGGSIDSHPSPHWYPLFARACHGVARDGACGRYGRRREADEDDREQHAQKRGQVHRDAGGVLQMDADDHG